VVDKSEPVEELPEKYRGKSAIDIAKMHQEAEKLIGRQANEVHEVRSLADQLLKQQLESKAREAKPIEESLEDDFFADPAKAVNRQVEKHPAVIEAKQAALEMKRMKTAQQLASKHPDYATIASDTGFQDWVRSSAIRLNLFARADADFDFDSADELISTYKELKQIKQYNQQTQTAAVESKAQDQAMRAATVDVGGAGETSRKVYRRADLIKLRMTDPERYMQMSDEIMAAYSEGRVK
jgi:outer membrane protein OmpA-like peptidoglycan-associated protein